MNLLYQKGETAYVEKKPEPDLVFVQKSWAQECCDHQEVEEKQLKRNISHELQREQENQKFKDYLSSK